MMNVSLFDHRRVIITNVISLNLAIIALLIIPTCFSHTLRHAHYRYHAAASRASITSSGVIASGGGDASHDNNNVFLNTTYQWLNQTLDHFAPEGSRKFPQRYYEFLDYFDAPHGPIFLVICGESTCGGIYNDYIGVLAKHFGAALVTLEHRYYGRSSPFSDLSTHNLQYLTSKQALSDLAAFRNYYQDLMNQKYHLSHTAENAWITFGGSYSGALSAWFRLKFPHLTCGSLASSAVIHAIENYFEYDQQVAQSVGPDCTRALQAVTAVANDYFERNTTYLKSLFNAEAIENDVDVLSLLADSTALAVQYGIHDVLCRPLVQSFQEGNNVLTTYQDFVERVIYKQFGITPLDYSRQYIKNSSLHSSASGIRLWTYQFCTEFGFFQTAPTRNSIRFTQINKEYYLDLCTYIFDEGTTPRSGLTNLYYGGTKIGGSRIFFVNGSQDPWRHASKQVSSPDEPAFVVFCKNCAHCVDIEGCPQFPFNPQGNASFCEPRHSIDKARKLITEKIKLWLQED